MIAALGAGFAVAAAVAAGGCGGKTPAPSPPATTPAVPGATVVTGRERLAWYQPGDGTLYSYRAYIDGMAVSVDQATCTVGDTESDCSGPLPAMSDGVHTIELVTVAPGTDYESERSPPLTVQKVSTRANRSASQLPDAITEGRVSAPSTILIGGVELAADVIARDVLMPAQLAPLPDGRVLVAAGDGHVYVVHPGDPGGVEVALDAARLLDPPPTGALALAVPPDVATTRHAFVSYTYRDGAARLRARIVRLREVGDRLGEPAAIFDAALTPEAPAGGDAAGGHERLRAETPRLAFGPDGLLYVALPPGLGFDGHPAASLPVPAVVRLTADGRTPTDGALTGVSVHPLAIAWHPSTRQLLGLLPDKPARAIVRPLDVARDGANAGIALFRSEGQGAERLLRFDALTTEGVLDLAQIAIIAAREWPSGVARLAVPADLNGLVPGLRGRLEDLVSGDGVIYAAIADDTPGGPRDGTTGVVVRLRP